MNPIVKMWIFKSSSGQGKYQTLQYADGATSCDCPGWTKRVYPGGRRMCKHTRLVDAGMADDSALSVVSYKPGEVMRGREIKSPASESRTAEAGATRTFDLT